MRRRIEFVWEKIDEETSRAKVLGGWLLLHVKTTKTVSKSSTHMQQSESMIFVNDKDHEWHITAQIREEVISNVKNTVEASKFASPVAL